MGAFDKLISKYRHTANLSCQKVRIEKNNDDEHEHAMIGENCIVKVAGMSFNFDSVKVNCDEVSSACDIKRVPTALSFKFELKDADKKG